MMVNKVQLKLKETQQFLHQAQQQLAVLPILSPLYLLFPL
jgi:hypothetical protein